MTDCTKCGAKKRRHYREYCPLCDKPQVKVIRTLDLIEALAHVSAKHYAEDTSIYRDAGYENLWSYLCNHNYINNDSTTAINFPDVRSDQLSMEIEHRALGKAGLLYLDQLIEAFELESLHMKDIQWVVSW